ncbi:polyadenylate-binding protein-interacting protein 1 isoform X1 [Biomphalaria glabrata]|nr:polyadenylate-binding protein-interacting protein 1 isoform X1 [Biomphalaria glabrata]
MSSIEKANDGQQLGTIPHLKQEMAGDGSYSSPRPPRAATESRVLSIVNQNKTQQLNLASDMSTPPPVGNNPTQSYQQQLTLPEIKSNLSATAKEFVPRSQVETGGDGPLYNTDSYSLSVSAAEFVPRGQDENSSFSEQYYSNIPYEYDSGLIMPDINGLSLVDYSSYSVQQGNTGNMILDRFNNTLYLLNMHPGNMEEYLRPICEMIETSSTSPEVLDQMVEYLFNQSIQQNFRYTGARICQFLTTYLKRHPLFSGFHKIFMKRCQTEYDKRMQLLQGNDEEQERLRGLAMLMAEIFLNVETELEGGGTQRIHYLPKILMDFVQTLLGSPTDANVKCSCQLLKLSGALMEDIVKSIPNQCLMFEDIFAKMNGLISHPGLAENTRFLVSSVIDLQNKDWNRAVSSPPKKPCHFQSDPNNFQAQEPVFYNNGAVCSRADIVLPEDETDDGAYVLNEEEEAAFLEWQAEQEALATEQETFFNDTGYESYNHLEEVVDDGDMGDEVEAAYEEFLQEQSNYIQGYQSNQPSLPLQPQPLIHPSMMFQSSPNFYISQPPPNAMPPHMQLPPNQQTPDQHPHQQQYGDSYYHRPT